MGYPTLTGMIGVMGAGWSVWALRDDGFPVPAFAGMTRRDGGPRGGLTGGNDGGREGGGGLRLYGSSRLSPG